MPFELYLKRPRAWAWPLLLLEAIEARWCGAADEADAACAVAAARVGLEKDLVRGVLVHICSTACANRLWHVGKAIGEVPG